MARRHWIASIVLVALLVGIPMLAAAQKANGVSPANDDVLIKSLSADPAASYTTSLGASAAAWEAANEGWTADVDTHAPQTVPVPEPGALNILLGTLAVLGFAGLARWWNNRI